MCALIREYRPLPKIDIKNCLMELSSINNRIKYQNIQMLWDNLLITVYIIGTLNTQEPYIYFKMQAITSVTQFY